MSQLNLAVVIDQKRLQRVFRELANLGDDGRGITRIVAGALLSSTEQAFEKEASPEGESWVAWSEPWKEWRKEHNYVPGKVLTLKGDLARSVTTDYGPDWALIGSNKPYAAIHQWGGTPNMAQGPAAIPARPYMGLDNIGEQEIIEAIKKRVQKALGGTT